jgi:hypothetical protein
MKKDARGPQLPGVLPFVGSVGKNRRWGRKKDEKWQEVWIILWSYLPFSGN